MKTLVSLAAIAGMFMLPTLASADKKGKGPKDYWKQQEKWDKEQRKREEKYWKEYHKRSPYPPVPYYGPRPEAEGYIGPYRFEIWRD